MTSVKNVPTSVEEVELSDDAAVAAAKAARAAQLADLTAVMATAAGRRLMWRLLGHCGTFESIFETSSRIYYNSGRQDVGHFLLAEITTADVNQFIQMQHEAMKGGT